MAPPHSRPPFAPQLLEIPLQLAITAFSVTLLGLNAWDYARWQTLREKSRINNFVEIQDNGMLTVVLAAFIIAAFAFAFANLAAVLACAQFPKRRGERTGKGTYAYLLVGLVELILSGAFLAIAAAYTAYAVQKHPSFIAEGQITDPATSTTQQLAAIGVWANINTLEQANAFLAQNRYLNYKHYRVTTAISFVTLATTFFVMSVHFLLPLILKALGMTRPPKAQESAVRGAGRVPVGYGEKRMRNQGYRREDYDEY
ncbi:hypothetical protein NDA11_004318 [Ustilago hordei]|nr:hypothetical protein NDA10_007284 [Ustilago hordei]KAJ1581483.1 hypothetical protein NDA11_004318 [Ustilago hordei]KAJ1597185.1 hypothetical protein NDA14_000072 [Ustilago hordei]UTT91997.1 hypothetical protein NDA17_006988 [Ustilago hordei]